MTDTGVDTSVDDLVFDQALQIRADIPAIDNYKLLLDETEFWPFDKPIVAFRIRGKLKVVDGFTRGRAAIAAGWKTVPVAIMTGTAEDALRYAFGCNATHGYARTNADKRKAVLMAIAHYKDDQQVTQAQIALICKVSHTYVRKLMEEVTQEEQPEPEYHGHGECPVCSVDQWVEDSGGYKCGACGHVLGTPTPRQRTQASQAKVLKAQLENPPPSSRRPEAKQDAPKITKGSNTKQLAEQASTSLGQLVRLLERLEQLEPLREHLEAIQKAINRKKKAK